MDKKKVTIVGVGALGSHVALFLRNEALLKVIDMDRTEAKNLLSQFHAKTTLGKNKTEGLKQVMSLLFGVKVEGFPTKLTKDNDKTLLGGSDLIIDCLDNGEARRIVQNYARGTKTPCVHGGLAANGAFGVVRWDQDFVIDDEPGVGAVTCEDGAHLPFIAMASSCLAKAAQTWLQTGKMIGFNIHEGGAVRT